MCWLFAILFIDDLNIHTVISLCSIAIFIWNSRGLGHFIISAVASLGALSFLVKLGIGTNWIEGSRFVLPSIFVVVTGYFVYLERDSDRRLSSWDSDKPGKTSFALTLGLLSPIALFGTHWNQASGYKTFSFLAHHEDNAAWLQGLSFGLKQDGIPRFDRNLGWGGDTGLAIVNHLLQSLEFFGHDGRWSLAENSGLLYHISGLFFILTVISAGLVANRVSTNLNFSNTQVFIAQSVSMFLTFFFASAVMSRGHLTLVMAIFFFSILVLTTMELRSAQGTLGRFAKTRTFLFPALISVLLATVWTPLIPFSFAMIIGVLIYSSKALVADRKTKIPRALYVLVIVPIFGFYRYFGEMRLLFDREWIDSTLGFGGATATAGPLLFLCLVGLTLSLMKHLANELPNESEAFFKTLPIILIFGYAASLFVFSFAGPNNALNYAALKMQLFTSAVIVPIAVVGVFKLASSKESQANRLLAATSVLVLFAYEGSISQYTSYPWKFNKSEVFWARAAYEEISANPQRRLVCLNTSNAIANIEAYNCNRLIVGLQGEENNSAIERWIPLGMWLADPSVLWSQSPEFYKTLTVMKFDASNSTVTDVNVQLVLDRLRWDLVRTIDVTGQAVTSFPVPKS